MARPTIVACLDDDVVFDDPVAGNALYHTTVVADGKAFGAAVTAIETKLLCTVEIQSWTRAVRPELTA